MKPIIYQLFVRLFGNRNTRFVRGGSIAENGSGKFDDITAKALFELKNLGITHIWYTGILEHSTLSDYSAFGIAPDAPEVVKGRAGSPYAVKDYYDVAPDLAVDVARRMDEFENLLARTHAAGLKAIIDFVPNHVARKYHSDAKPAGVRDLGEDDDTKLAFSPQNNFYYIVGQSFLAPQTGGDSSVYPLNARRFDETPAKATGNDLFSASPAIDDWFETVKLNYGIDYCGGGKKHFEPTPDAWLKMTDILLFSAKKGVDGFRCDMCEMVPAEFWHYAVGKVKAGFPDTVFLGEAYNPSNYRTYLNAGFDYLYDKDGLYDTLRAIIRGESGFEQLVHYRYSEVHGIERHMLAFLENHDEQRLASPYFAGEPFRAIPAMTVAALSSVAPVMIYNGQESGEDGNGVQGFGGGNGRTSIFDYTAMPLHQRWINGGAFDGGGLNDEQRRLRSFYQKLLKLCNSEKAVHSGGFYDLQSANAHSPGFNPHLNYVFMRYADGKCLLVFATVDTVPPEPVLKIPPEAANLAGIKPDLMYRITICDTDQPFTCEHECRGADLSTSGLHLRGQGMSAAVLRIE